MNKVIENFFKDLTAHSLSMEMIIPLIKEIERLTGEEE
jgi:hypothetical protein